LKAMEKDRSQRYPSVSELAADIRSHMDDRPVGAGPPSRFYLCRKFVQRHKRAISAGLFVACSLIAGIVATAWEARVAESRRRVAEWQSYVANVRAAEGLIESNEAAQARQILLTCPPQLRDWEWKHLSLETDSSLATLHPFAPPLPYDLWSPNGDLSFAFNRQKNAIVLQGLDSTRAQAWDLRSYRPSGYYGGLGRIQALSSDGTQVIVSPIFTASGGASDFGLAVFDLISSRLIARVRWENQPPTTLSAVFSPDGSRAAALTEPAPTPYEDSHRIIRHRKLIVWETNSGRILATIDGSHIGRSLVFSPDGKRILSGGRISANAHPIRKVGDTDIPWADLVEEQLIGANLKPVRRLGNGNLAHSLVFSPDGKRIAAALADEVRVWDATTGRPLLTFQGGKIVGFVAYSPDSANILVGSDRVVRIRNAVTGAITATLQGHDSWVNAATFTPDRKRIFTAQMYPPAIKVWAADSCCAVNTLAGHQQAVRLAVFSPDQRFLASASDDLTVRLWDIASGKEIRVLRGHGTSVGAIAFSSDGTLLASGADDGTILIWHVSSGKVIHFIAAQEQRAGRIPAAFRGVTSLAFNRDATQLVSGSKNGTVQIWDARLGSQLKQIQVVDPKEFSKGLTQVNSVQIGRSGQILSSSSFSLIPGMRAPVYLSGSTEFDASAVRVWDASTGKAAVDMTQIAKNVGAISAEYSPDGLRIIGVLTDATAAVWESATGKMITTMRYGSTGIQAAVFQPGGTRIFTVSGDAIQVWDARSFQMIVALHGPDVAMPFLAFSHDGSTMASGSQDGALHIWKTRSVSLSSH
jgi:WD40 repeat protein